MRGGNDMSINYRVTLDDGGAWSVEQITMQGEDEVSLTLDEGRLSAWSIKEGREDRLLAFARDKISALPVTGEPVVSDGMYVDADGFTCSVLMYTWGSNA